MEKLDWFLQEDIKQLIRNTLGQEQWVTVFKNEKRAKEYDMFFYCALVPDDQISNVLENPNFDISYPYFGYPSTESDPENAGQAIYSRFGSSSSLEPLVFKRHFYGVKPEYLEISQEFVHFFNLYYDTDKNSFFMLHDDGKEEDVVRMSDSMIQIRRKHIRQFLAFKEMHLALYFETTRFIPHKVEVFGLPVEGDDYNEMSDLYHFGYWCRNEDFPGDIGAFSRIMGKKLIPGIKKEDTGIYPFENTKKYHEFIIGLDENGKELVFPCNPDKLGNYFGGNPEAPLYVTPVFFRKDVLKKYYDDPEKFTVKDSYLHCGGLWGLRMDNDHENFVIVLLGDLGSLSESEQLYWKSFNIIPDGTFSETAYKRFFLAEFAEAETLDLVFKNMFTEFQEKWHKKYGWHLFKPLNKGDEYHFSGLRIPIKDTQVEFDSQVLSLTKIMIDSLNEKELTKVISQDVADMKGISKFEQYLIISGSLVFRGVPPISGSHDIIGEKSEVPPC